MAGLGYRRFQHPGALLQRQLANSGDIVFQQYRVPQRFRVFRRSRGAGDDQIDASAGADTIKGGGGAGVFVLTSEDCVSGFKIKNGDQISVSDLLGGGAVPDALADDVFGRAADQNGSWLTFDTVTDVVELGCFDNLSAETVLNGDWRIRHRGNAVRKGRGGRDASGPSVSTEQARILPFDIDASDKAAGTFAILGGGDANPQRQACPDHVTDAELRRRWPRGFCLHCCDDSGWTLIATKGASQLRTQPAA